MLFGVRRDNGTTETAWRYDLTASQVLVDENDSVDFSAFFWTQTSGTGVASVSML
mgnify:CR=1 FL=1